MIPQIMNTASEIPDWYSYASVLLNYVRRHGQLPRQSGNERGPEESKAGNILKGLRRRAQGSGDREGLPADLRAWLDRNVAGWQSDNARPAARGMRGHRDFAMQVRKVKRFAFRNGQFPSAGSSDPREAALGRFLRNHRQALRGANTTTSWNESKERMLDRHVPGWDLGLRERMTSVLELSKAI